MVTIEKIKTEFSHIIAWTENSEVYHSTVVFEDHGAFCDLYFKSNDKNVKQEQVDAYNKFEATYRNYIGEIELFIKTNLNSYETNNLEKITNLILTFDVIELPYDNFKYDLVLVCGKVYKQFFFFKKTIDIRVEFKNGRIRTIQRKKDTTKENV